MSKDITPILRDWHHESEELQVRIVPGLDGRDKIQMRLELGLLQMEMEGRPDGQMPHGHTSLLEFHEARATESPTYTLTSEDCSALLRGRIQYYHRYISLFHLELYELVARDTARNLQLFRFVRAHAPDEGAAFEFDRYRPFVIMMNTRAEALQAMARGDRRAAMQWVDKGLSRLAKYFEDYPRQEMEECQEITFLQTWREQIASDHRPGTRERLEALLADAVAREDYEQAARLRDRLRRLDAPAQPGPAPESPL